MIRIRMMMIRKRGWWWYCWWWPWADTLWVESLNFSSVHIQESRWFVFKAFSLRMSTCTLTPLAHSHNSHTHTRAALSSPFASLASRSVTFAIFKISLSWCWGFFFYCACFSCFQNGAALLSRTAMKIEMALPSFLLLVILKSVNFCPGVFSFLEQQGVN